MIREYAISYDPSSIEIANWDPDIVEWLSHRTPWNDALRSGKFYVTFFNPLTGYLTVLPGEEMKPYTLYFPTNAPGTEEKYLRIFLAVNGTPSFNYREDEERFDESFNYLSDKFETEVHISIRRKAVEKEDRWETDITASAAIAGLSRS